MSEQKANVESTTKTSNGQVTPEAEQAKKKKNPLLLGIKVLFSVGMLTVILRKILHREGAEDLGDRIAEISWGWFVAAIAMQLIAVAFSTVRWQRLLVGQGIRAPWRFLTGSILIARFWGAFTPGGFTGFGGWRIYDIAKHTGKTARATATIGVEIILGQLAFGAVVMAGSVFGAQFLGTQGVLLVNGFFLVVIAAGIGLISKPTLFQTLCRFLPGAFQQKVASMVDAVCAYHGKSKLLIQAAALGMGTHAFNNLIYVCAARALGVELSVGTVFFGSSIQILATLLPASINGIGLREAAAVALYTKIGVPTTVAFLIPVVGFAAEMLVSSVGGILFMIRKGNYDPNIEVEDADRESEKQFEAKEEDPSKWPRPWKGLWIGLQGGLIGGSLVGLGEALAVQWASAGDTGTKVWLYGVLGYGVLGAEMGAAGGFVLAWWGRQKRRTGIAVHRALARWAGLSAGFFGLALTAFRLRRDVFHEELVWKSVKGLAVLGTTAVVVAGVAFAFSKLIEWSSQRKFGAWVTTPKAGLPWGGTIVWLSLAIPLWALAQFGTDPKGSANTTHTSNCADKPPVFLFVVDTLRADHLPAYGHDQGNTPHLDALAEDAVRFDQAFANASWTRPSFASILTGRFASSHGVMAKSHSLPDDVTTVAESMQEAGYITSGIVTNYNVAPYFNFQQGFQHYRYLSPKYVLGADDGASKLLWLQFVRQRIEKIRAVSGKVEPGTAYQDAKIVNQEILSEIDQHRMNNPGGPARCNNLFLFAGYMDPHDPYFPHPYDGSGYSRAAHQHPDPSEAETLRALYNGEITYWDTQFGQLIGELKQRGLYDDAWIIVTSDHGEEFNEHGGFWHGTTLYDEQIRVPLIVKLPQARRGGTTVRHWVQSVDIMPTLLSELGIPVPKGVQGGQLFQGTDTLYAEESHEGNVLEAIRQRKGTRESKLITANPGNPRGLPNVEYFHVDLDPGETNNLAATEPAQVQFATQSLVEQSERARTGAVASTSVELDEAAATRLKNLGYMTDEKKE